MAKIIKSSQVGCDTPAIECSCGGSCFGSDSGASYRHTESKYYCEECDQTWVFPENMDIVVKFKRRAV